MLGVSARRVFQQPGSARRTVGACRGHSAVGLIEFVLLQVDYLNFVVCELAEQNLLDLFVATIAQVHSIPFDDLISYIRCCCRDRYIHPFIESSLSVSQPVGQKMSFSYIIEADQHPSGRARARLLKRHLHYVVGLL